MLKFLSTLWLVVALAAAPVQVLNASTQTGAHEHCQMHMDGVDAAGTDCPHCTDRSCSSDDSCSDSSCASMHIQPAVFSAAQLVNLNSTDIPGPTPVFETGFGAPPPPLRPPV